MRFHALTLTGVGPFRHTQQIDFDAVSASGLFLIEGPTGAGKSTIIDAIVFALYGSLTGQTGVDHGRMRSLLCEPNEPTEVVLEFSVAGVRHTITRNPPYERAKARGEGTTQERAAQTLLVHDDGMTPPMREAKEIGAYIAERTGLDVHQFRRLVVLPQGEFAALLRAKPSDRYDALASLIDDGFLARVQDELKQNADAAAEARAAALRDANDIRGVLRERIREADADLIDDDSVMPLDAEAITTLQTTLAERAALLSQEVATCEQRAEAARTAATLAEQSLTAARDYVGALARLTSAREAAAAFDPTWATLNPEALRAKQQELTAQRERLIPLADWEAAEPERRAHAATLAEAVRSARATLADLREQSATLPARRIAADEAVDVAARSAAAAPLAQTAVDALTALRAAATELEQARTALDAARRSEAAAGTTLEAERKALYASRQEASSLLRSQLEQRAAHLAGLLHNDQPCPVCGSTHHPQPARAPDEGLITDDQVAQSEAAVDAAEGREAAAAAHHAEAQRRVQDANTQEAAARAKLGDVDPATIESELRQALDHLTAVTAQAAGLTAAELARAALEKEGETLTAAVESAVTVEAVALTREQESAERVAAEQVAVIAAVGPDTTATAALTALERAAVVLEELLAAHEFSAASSATIDVSTAQARVAEAVQIRRQADDALKDLQARHHQVTSACAAIDVLVQRWHDARTAAEAVVQRTTPIINLSALVTAAKGSANDRNLMLKAYAVQRRFAAVLDAASAHLERMSSGKFTFTLDETASHGAKTGLGIDVVDAWSGRPQDPSSLSGGETFYASLSLALGLADVVREESGGLTLETLFVDEGFGSLDQETLSVVLDQLDALRSRGRTVGVISHVTEMKEWVHDRIDVIPGRPGEGSTITQTGR